MTGTNQMRCVTFGNEPIKQLELLFYLHFIACMYVLDNYTFRGLNQGHEKGNYTGSCVEQFIW